MEEIYWECFFNNAGISGETSKEYAVIFVKNKISDALLSHLNESYLKAMGIDAIGDIIRILKYAKDYLLQKDKPPKAIKEFKEHSIEKLPVKDDSDDPKIVNKKLTITSTYSKVAGCELPVPVKRIVTPEIEGKYKIKYPSKSTVIITEQPETKVPQQLKAIDVNKTSNRIVILNDTPQSAINQKVSVLKRLGQSLDKYQISSSSDDDEDFEKEIIKKQKVEVSDNKLTLGRVFNTTLSREKPVNMDLSKKITINNKRPPTERTVFSRLGDSPKEEEAVPERRRHAPPDASSRVKIRSGHSTEHLHRAEATSTTEVGSLRSDALSAGGSRNVLNRLGQKF